MPKTPCFLLVPYRRLARLKLSAHHHLYPPSYEGFGFAVVDFPEFSDRNPRRETELSVWTLLGFGRIQQYVRFYGW